jgi:hypothetical protein
MYWSYGTAYHVVLAAALQSLTGSTHGLDAYEGFAESAEYINAMTAPSGEYFNYADCAAQRRIQAQLFWMAKHWDRPDWLAHDLASLERDLEEYRANPSTQYWYYDMVALALLWRKPTELGSGRPVNRWSGGGKMPVATYRWGDGSFFLGVKGGSVGLSHSHMDVGSFVFEASGVRWAVDLGMQDYAGLEAAGVDLWNEREQESQRWSVFRIGPESHNILRFGDLPQNLMKHAPLSAGAAECVVDLSGIYDEPVATASRSFVLADDGFLLTDVWAASYPITATTQWMTFAEVQCSNGNVLTLQEDGCRLRVEVEGTCHISVESMDGPVRSFDAPNPRLKRVSISSATSLEGSVRLRVVCE